MTTNLISPQPIETQSVVSDASLVQEKPLDGSLHSACSPPHWGQIALGFVTLATVYPLSCLAGFLWAAAEMGFNRGRRDFITLNEWAEK